MEVTEGRAFPIDSMVEMLTGSPPKKKNSYARRDIENDPRGRNPTLRS